MADTKAYEARRAIFDGATELDMVMNIGALKSGDRDLVLQDIKGVVDIAHEADCLCKVIIETALLTDEEKTIASLISKEAGADFVKTCTGFGPGRATVHDIGLLKETVGDRIGIKASGGVASLEDGVALMRAGATVVAMRRFLVEQLESLQWRPNP